MFGSAPYCAVCTPIRVQSSVGLLFPMSFSALPLPQIFLPKNINCVGGIQS